MPCNGPCGVSKLGNNHQDYRREDDPACYLDSGHKGPHSWESEYARLQTKAMANAVFTRDAQTNAATVTMKQLLCASCKVLTRYDYDFDENPALSQWWDEHEKEDTPKGMTVFKYRKIGSRSYAKAHGEDGVVMWVTRTTQPYGLNWECPEKACQNMEEFIALVKTKIGLL